MVLVSGQCQSDQKSLSIQMKNSFIFDVDSTPPAKMSQWSESTDCCDWNGVDCDEAGHVIGLDLSAEPILIGSLENASGLFSLQYLQSLNLGFTLFYGFPMPSRLANLTNLTYLNLSHCGFTGEIPTEISSLSRLVTLDLSGREPISGFSWRLEIPNFNFFQNLTELRELYLDNVDLSGLGTEWCKALSFLPNLQVLDLSRSLLSGPINHHLVNLRSLSVIRLRDNHAVSCQVPEFVANLLNLTTLDLSQCDLHGKFPEKVLQVPTLETLDLSYNPLLQGSLPHFPKNSSLQNLNLKNTSFSGTLPDSIGNLENLASVDVSSCNFTGPIPTSMANLTQLFHLDFSSNHFSGPIPTLRLYMSRNLSYLNLSSNDLTRGISSTGWEQLSNLRYVVLSYNLLNGSIPRSLFLHPTLETLLLSNNQFENQLPELSNVSSSVLSDLDLNGNRLEGPVPISIFFELRNLETLDLSSNKFSRLRLASSKPRVIPKLTNLDLSNNQISGEVLVWEKYVDETRHDEQISDGGVLRTVGAGQFYALNLSHNLLESLQEPYSISRIGLLDLHSNQLRGSIPYMSPNTSYVDYSNNNFTSIPADIGNFMSETAFLSAANNSLTGIIAESVCKANYFQVLDLSNNDLSGTIPTCLITKSSRTLGVLNLARNHLNGTLSDTIPGNCGLQILDINGNQLEGMVPKSLVNCNMFDKFPCWLKNASGLQVLVLRSNKFSGNISCPRNNVSWTKLQIVDLASNNFSGRLSQKWLLTLEEMMDAKTESGFEFKHLRYATRSSRFYEVTVSLTIKGLEIMLQKITNIFTSIDLSSNNFEEQIPEEMGQFVSLYALNLSHNALTGSIPSSFGNLKLIESLDLSTKNLSGKIPAQLASLNFLSVLNLSYNNLVGKIPTSTQLQSFSPTSYEGNKGLYGPPLTNESQTRPSELPPSPPPASSDEIDWFFIAMSIGFAVGFGAVVSPLMFSVQARYIAIHDHIPFVHLKV
ncbi:hypothetical protein KPL70_020990 [Citrus sinensis]|uniref:Leucine-rich repeat-containing N-terminal plant-type domain-containing protein n=1 Tax=Citrus clementina TaxID=85681 RepID=V4SPH5_CITCL|nr:hypothetical protein CICLE_v10027041mg [Citrus x clementina]KAH9667320.1 hypothetical protein KPL70_020990 [Citrus sinensis]